MVNCRPCRTRPPSFLCNSYCRHSVSFFSLSVCPFLCRPHAYMTALSTSPPVATRSLHLPVLRMPTFLALSIPVGSCACPPHTCHSLLSCLSRCVAGLLTGLHADLHTCLHEFHCTLCYPYVHVRLSGWGGCVECQTTTATC